MTGPDVQPMPAAATGPTVPHRRRLGVLYLVLAVVSLGTLMIGLSGTDTAELS